MNILIIASFTLSLFFAFLIFTKKDKVLADNILTVWLCIVAFHLIGYYFERNQLAFSNVLAECSGALVFLHGPLLLYYLIFIHKKETSKSIFLHLVPFLINTISLPFLVIHDHYPTNITLGIFKLISGLVYPIIILRLAEQYKREITDYFSEIDSKLLNWLKIVITGILLITLTGIIGLLLTDVFLVEIELNGELYTVIFLSLFVFIIGFNGLKQTSIFINIPTPVQTEIIESTAIQNITKYQNTGLSTASSIDTFQRVRKYVIEHKSFLDADLTLSKLAESLELSSNQLSQVINQNTKDNFFVFVNSFRVEEVIQQIKEGKHKELTLLAIAYSAGFNSKSSFNRSFKKIMNVTPTQYINSL